MANRCNWLLPMVSLSFLVCACKDAPPAPPAYDNINDIVVNGEHMTAAEYHEKFCVNASPEIINHIRCTEAKSKAWSDERRKELERDLKRLEGSK